MSQYIEITPGREPIEIPIDNGVGHGWERIFHRLVPDHGHGPHAVISTAFYVGHAPDEPPADGPGLLIQRTTYSLHPHRDHRGQPDGGSYRVIGDMILNQPENGSTDADARSACAAFDPTDLTWDGYPTSHLPCQITVRDFGANGVAAYCDPHRGTPMITSATGPHGGARRGFVCDKGRNRRYLIDRTVEGTPNPYITDINGVRLVLERTVEASHYGHDHDRPPRVYFYPQSGVLVPLTIRRAVAEEGRHYIDDDDRKALLLTQRWEVVDTTTHEADDVSDPGTRPLTHLSTVVTLNGDA